MTWQPDQQKFLLNFLHDMMTPLVGIRGLSQLLKEPLTVERREEATRIIAAQVDNMHGLMDQLGAIVKEGDLDEQLPVAMDTIEMTFLVKVASNTAAKGSPEVFERIHAKIEFDNVVIIPNLLRVRRILTNLISNAIRHTDGPVEVYVRGGHRLLLEVHDRGKGLAEGFDQIGLGIRIVKDLAISLDGEAVWDSRPGGGLIARVTLPL